ncbi:hypothetical protein LSH36_241g02017 [Paralvinella palmiformis]|uniref:Uncharacterized protein n=1 Tax=Paralvinella palmiformis TaxID=53620 RepID=A0AAD9N5U0_9ANNE|nr:hypothetical protein LSH36_241g02017 [Paralvinella palmiformis]
MKRPSITTKNMHNQRTNQFAIRRAVVTASFSLTVIVLVDNKMLNVLRRRSLNILLFVVAIVTLFYGALKILQSVLKADNVHFHRHLCTHKLFRKYYQDNGFFPSAGRWKGNDESAYFSPDDCEFHDPLIQQSQVAKCFLQANISYVVVLGDSNGGHNFEALLSLIGGNRCNEVKKEAMGDTRYIPDINYFGRENQSWARFITYKKRSCTTCTNRIVVCHVTEASQYRAVKLEFVSLSRSIDQTVTIEKYIDNNSSEYFAASSSQEFYFKYYFKNRYPDIIVLFPPFNHDKRAKMSQNRNDTKRLKSILDDYVPRTTRIFYIPAFSEFENKRKGSTYFNKKYHGYLAATKINWLNHKLYSMLEKDLLRGNGNVYGFLDVFTISKSRENWSTDGVHMKSVWYKNEMSMFLQLFCNSVSHGAF